MTSIRTRSAIVLVLSQLFAGCGGSLPLPSAPSSLPVITVQVPSPPASVLIEATLSGTVYELVDGSPVQRRGVEGVSVYCEPCGESTHNFANTDANGEYVFPRGVWKDRRTSFPIAIFVRKDGYGDPPGLPTTTPPNPSGPGWREVVINGDTRFDIELVRR